MEVLNVNTDEAVMTDQVDEVSLLLFAEFSYTPDVVYCLISSEVYIFYILMAT